MTMTTFENLDAGDRFEFVDDSTTYVKLDADRYQMIGPDGTPTPGLTFRLDVRQGWGDIVFLVPTGEVAA